MTIVSITKPFPPYFSGERVGKSREEAMRLVSEGVAIIVKDPMAEEAAAAEIIARPEPEPPEPAVEVKPTNRRK